MRRAVFTSALLVLLTIPVYAQRRGFAPGMGGARMGGARMGGARTIAPFAARPSGRVVIRGGFGFGHNPGVFFGPRRFHHRRFFFNPFFNSFFSPFNSFNSFPLYPYYPYGLQSDFLYSNAAVPQAQQDYSASQTAQLSNEISRLSAEVDMLRAQQYSAPERQQYALNSPSETPRAMPSTAPRQQAPAQPTVLIFRDGRRLEVHNYAVVGQTLWIFSEERARKVPLSDLNLDATRQTNEERGVEFNVHSPAPTGGPAQQPKGARPISLS